MNLHSLVKFIALITFLLLGTSNYLYGSNHEAQCFGNSNSASQSSNSKHLLDTDSSSHSHVLLLECVEQTVQESNVKEGLVSKTLKTSDCKKNTIHFLQRKSYGFSRHFLDRIQTIKLIPLYLRFEVFRL